MATEQQIENSSKYDNYTDGSQPKTSAMNTLARVAYPCLRIIDLEKFVR
jgi:hypothetical protein